MVISLIVAVADNGIIGKENGLPWHIGADLKRFKAITTGHTILMGKNTYLSIGRPLPNRRNVVLSRSLTAADVPGCELIASLDELDKLGLEPGEELFVIGGARVYEQLMPKADKLYLTRVRTQADGDVKFPEVDWDEWQLCSETHGFADEKNDFDYCFQNYERKKK